MKDAKGFTKIVGFKLIEIVTKDELGCRELDSKSQGKPTRYLSLAQRQPRQIAPGLKLHLGGVLNAGKISARSERIVWRHQQSHSRGAEPLRLKNFKLTPVQLNTTVSSIALAQYVFQLLEDCLLDCEPDRLADRMEQAELSVPDLSGRIGQPI